MKILLIISALFLSTQSPVAHQETTLYAVVSNQTDAAFTGTLKLLEKKQVLAASPITLKGFESRSIPLSWTPTTTSHTLTAEIYDQNKMLLEDKSQTFAVGTDTDTSPTLEKDDDTKKTPSVFASSTAQSSEKLEGAIAKVSPTTAHVVAPALNATDSARGWLIGYIEQARSWAQIKLEAQETKAPFGDVKNSTSTNTSNVSTAKAEAVRYSLVAAVYTSGAAIYVIGHIALFYPVFAFIFFLILWRTYWYFSTPRFDRY